MSEYLRDVAPRPRRPARDPLGKAALFSDDARRPGTLLVDCSACGESSRMTYVEFACAHLPFSMWLPPLHQLPYNRRITCPSCTEWAWVRTHWLQ